jgi:hypothetical protein
MNQDFKYDDLLATRWIRELTESEQAGLESLFSTAPALRERWEEDMAVLDGVGALPDVHVSSNFTHQVMTSLARRVGEDVGAKTPVAEVSWMERLGFVPKLGVGFALVLAVFGSFLQYKEGNSAKLVESLAIVTESDTVPSVEELQHFEAIQMLAQVPVDVDWELIAATE